jgi:dihydroorotate dehydrogenase (NAD+) catalytic subunit
MMAGASAVQIGTASFANPAASERILDELAVWCAHRGVDRISDLVGAAHG